MIGETVRPFLLPAWEKKQAARVRSTGDLPGRSILSSRCDDMVNRHTGISATGTHPMQLRALMYFDELVRTNSMRAAAEPECRADGGEPAD